MLTRGPLALIVAQGGARDVVAAGVHQAGAAIRKQPAPVLCVQASHADATLLFRHLSEPKVSFWFYGG